MLLDTLSPMREPDADEAFDALGRFIQIFENDRRKTVSKDYVLSPRSVHRGAMTK